MLQSSDMTERLKPKEKNILRMDINPPRPLSEVVSKESPFKMSDDIAAALETAIVQFERFGVPIDKVLGYYLLDAEGSITNLEVRNVPMSLAQRIDNELVVAHLDISMVLTEKGKYTVGLPDLVDDFHEVAISNMNN